MEVGEVREVREKGSNAEEQRLQSSGETRYFLVFLSYLRCSALMPFTVIFVSSLYGAHRSRVSPARACSAYGPAIAMYF